MPSRSLRPEEIAEVQQVFGDSLDLDRIRINEGSNFPNLIGRVGAFFRRTAPPEHNAITVGNTCHFPIALKTDTPGDPNWLRDMGWLIHELTHIWQYQHDGIRYLLEAMFAPTYTYALPNERPNDSLKGFSKAGKKFRDFNREQQGDIVRDYFWSLKIDGAGTDRSGWEAYLTEVRVPLKKERPRA